MAHTEQDLKSYRGNCHCGAFIFELKVPEIKSASQCNCSVCTKKGYLWTFPGDGMTIVKGEGALQEYTFGAGNTKHRFCPNCGTPVLGYNATFPAGKQMVVNARTIQGLDIWKLELKTFEGKALDPAYEPPAYTGPEPTAEIEGGKLYTGSCHCGAVKTCLKVKPLDSTYDGTGGIVECNCSICQRGAYIWIYPNKDQVVVQGADNLSYYAFATGTGVFRKAFCKTCGVYIMNDLTPMPAEQVAALPEQAQSFRARMIDIRPVTLRMLNNYNLDEIKDKVRQADGFNSIKPMYVNP